jgi:hypothetical protein
MIFKQIEQCDISITSEKNTDDLKTEIDSFWKKKNAKAIQIKDEFQYYFDVVELPVLKEYDLVVNKQKSISNIIQISSTI